MVDDTTMSEAYDSIMVPKPLVLTAPEVAAVVSQLEGERCTVRQVRYLLYGLLPSDTPVPRGHTRLYGPDDVALMRLAVRLHAQGVSAWVARVVLAYCGAEIRAAWRAGSASALVVRGVTGTIEAATADPSSAPASVRVSLRAVWIGVERAMRGTRRDRPQIWRGRHIPVTASQVERSA